MTDLDTAIRERIEKRLKEYHAVDLVDTFNQIPDDLDYDGARADYERAILRALRAVLIAALTGEGEK